MRFEVAAASRLFRQRDRTQLRRFAVARGRRASRSARRKRPCNAPARHRRFRDGHLEAAFFRLPFVLVYRVAWPTYLAARLVVRVKYLGMPNVLAGREIVPEFIQHRAKPRAIAQAALVCSMTKRRAKPGRGVGQDHRDALGDDGASRTAAQAIHGGTESGRGARAVST